MARSGLVGGSKIVVDLMVVVRMHRNHMHFSSRLLSLFGASNYLSIVPCVTITVYN